MMDLKKMFEMQKVLDGHIENEHPRQAGEDRLAKKILALLVELGELANEWRGFKYWSNNQDPRIVESKWCTYCDEYIIYEENKNPLLEEYVDSLHFILSIGLELKVKTAYQNILPIVDERLDNVTIMFHQIYACSSNLYWSLHYGTPAVIDYIELTQCFLRLGEMLGFTWEQIEKAYMEKNDINHKRQEAGY